MRQERLRGARWTAVVLAAALALATASGVVGAPAPASRSPVKVLVAVPAVTYDPLRWESTLLVANAWKALGMEVEIRPFADLPSLTARHSREPFDFDAFVSGYVGRPERLDPDALLYGPFHSKGIFDNGPNYMGYANPEYDRVVELQRKQVDAKKRQALVYKAEEILAKDAPTITLFHRQETFAYSDRRFRGMIPMVGRGLWNPWTVLEATPVGSDRTFRMGWATDIDGTNPLSINSAVESLRLVYDFLARVDKDGQPIPWAAQGWKKVTDTQVDIILRPGMVFHDGRPVTVEDVVFSFEFIRQHGTAPYFRGALEPIKTVRAVNDRVVRFVLHFPYPPLFMVTLTQIPILPTHVWRDVVSRERVDAPAKWANPTPIGSGPFQFVHWRRGEELMLRRFARHFQPPKAEGFLAVKYASPDAVFQAIVKGEVDIPDRSITSIQIDEAKRAGTVKLVSLPDFGVFYMGFNLRRAPFSSQKFRDAVKHTFDWKTIVEAALGGFGTPGTGMIAQVNKFWHNPAWDQWLKTDYKFDLALARQMLQQAGFTWDAQGRLLYP